MKNFKLINRN